MDIFKIVGNIIIKNGEAIAALSKTSDAAKQTAQDIGEAGSSGEKSSGKWGTAFKKIGKGALKVGKVVAVGIGAATTALGGLTAKALSSAGELEQNMSGSEAVFGKYADKIQGKAKEAFSNMGLSTSDYLATANKMGALFQGAGFSIEESMDLSSNAMQRAADVASIMGIDTASAMEAVAGAAKGNFTMMDNLGVAMNETTLANYALEKGMEKSYDQMTQQEKIGVAMEMFMDKTAYAAGNYANENETLAGSLGTAKAALSNFISGSGSVDDVVSSFSNAADVIVKNIDELFPKLMTGMTQIVEKIVPLIPPLLQKVLPGLIEGATGLINGLVAALPALLSALMSAVPALLDGIVQVVNVLIEALPTLMEMICSALPTLIPALVNGLVSMIVTLCANFAQIIQPLIDALPDIIVSIVNALMSNLPALIQGLVQLVFGIVKALPQILAAIWEAQKTLFKQWAQMLGNLFAPIKDALSKAWEAMGNVPGLAQLKTMIEKVWGAIKTHITTVINAIKNVVTTYWNSIKNVVGTVINAIKTVIQSAWNTIKTIIQNVMKLISAILKGDWEGVKQAISNIINAIKQYISTVWNAIKSVISSVMDAIKNVVSSVWDGIKSVVTSAVNTVKSVVTSVWNGIKSATSNAFNGIKNTAASAWNEIKSKITTPIEAARDKIEGIVDNIKGFFTGMKISIPKIKMPHFSISPSGWKIGDLLKGSIPKLGIEWYAKAMNNPMVMTSPTIFGYNNATGNLMGGGEVPGGEVVSGTNALMNMIGDVVENKTSAQNERIIAILLRVLEAILGGNQELLNALLAGHVIKLNEREVGRTVRAYA